MATTTLQLEVQMFGVTYTHTHTPQTSLYPSTLSHLFSIGTFCFPVITNPNDLTAPNEANNGTKHVNKS